jgi:NADH-quinone oxidoreductase subunit J
MLDLHHVLFIVFAIICVAGALNFLFQRHPVSSALSLIVVMGSLALLYLILGAEFVAAVQVIVYAGAVMVLFVFVIMLLNAGEEERTRGSKIALGLGVPALIAFFGALVYTVINNSADFKGAGIGGFYVSTKTLSLALFKEFLLPFEVTSVLILIAIMGAVVLAKREHL